mmetsp:Transcript_6781/g.19016  ORF Transcript_6781/g.19016 Transcript_6781/m.19016 type:complete len:213 (+) Transcript_6781:107-745(+)
MLSARQLSSPGGRTTARRQRGAGRQAGAKSEASRASPVYNMLHRFAQPSPSPIPILPRFTHRYERLSLRVSAAPSSSEEAIKVTEERRIPITVLTGFLGSGKTTTLNQILTKEHGKRIAIIENEFGEIDIDSKLVTFQDNTDEQIMMLNNGCLCCTVRGDLVEMIFKLYEERRNDFDHVVIETTGTRRKEQSLRLPAVVMGSHSTPTIFSVP